MGCITEVTTVHEVGSRIRFLVPQIKWSLKNQAELKKTLRGLRGVYHVHACVHTSTALIYYNPRKLSRDALMEAIHHCPFPEAEADKPKTSPPVEIKKRGRARANGHALSHVVQFGPALVFDLLKHGVIAGVGKAGGALPLALTAVMALNWFRKNGHRKNERMR